ncbi:MAG: hypothetical protein QXX08_01050 [Candidatus Bathyarchaeia archaeon]
MAGENIPEVLSRWLSSLFPTSIIHSQEDRIEVYEVEDGYSIGYRMAYCVMTRCGFELSDCYKNLGQCIVYCIENGFAPTYITVPEDHPHLVRLEKILSAINLPIGLITISPDGQVKVSVKPHVP